MPFYDFLCEACGTFEVGRPVREASDPASCPSCGRIGRRLFSAPGVVTTPAGLRRARDLEEKSAHEPDVVTEKRGRPRPHHHTPSPPWVASH